MTDTPAATVTGYRHLSNSTEWEVYVAGYGTVLVSEDHDEDASPEYHDETGILAIGEGIDDEVDDARPIEKAAEEAVTAFTIALGRARTARRIDELEDHAVADALAAVAS